MSRHKCLFTFYALASAVASETNELCHSDRAALFERLRQQGGLCSSQVLLCCPQERLWAPCCSHAPSCSFRTSAAGNKQPPPASEVPLDGVSTAERAALHSALLWHSLQLSPQEGVQLLSTCFPYDPDRLCIALLPAQVSVVACTGARQYWQ